MLESLLYLKLLRALIECHLDAHRRSDASHIAAAAASFIKANVPSLYKTVFGLMVIILKQIFQAWDCKLFNIFYILGDFKILVSIFHTKFEILIWIELKKL